MSWYCVAVRVFVGKSWTMRKLYFLKCSLNLVTIFLKEISVCFHIEVLTCILLLNPAFCVVYCLKKNKQTLKYKYKYSILVIRGSVWNVWVWTVPGSGLLVFVSRVAHGAELRDKEIVAAMVGRCVLLDVGKLHELQRAEEESANIHQPEFSVWTQWTPALWNSEK